MNANIERFPTNQSQPRIVAEGTIYNSAWQTGKQRLDIDARGDRISIHISEYNQETNRSKDISIQIERSIWEEYKKQINKYDGSII